MGSRKGNSFFSRFVGSKKKDPPIEAQDEESEIGDRRIEGVNADVFSQPIGFIPRFPAPPRYIKVRTHGKKEKEFDRLFLAQELRGKTGVEFARSGGRLVKNNTEAVKLGEPRKDGNAIWAMEFSKDGRFLAAGGQDFYVRVWAVLSSPEERRAHERQEDTTGKEGQSVRLSAPCFQKITVQEFGGHTQSILALSWSKNNFLLSSSMDKTVRLWHVSRAECLCCFKHNDFVTSVDFHPRDDRFFLAGSLDSKLRLWSIPDKSIAYWCQLPELITAVAFTPDGKTTIAGTLNGLLLFYDTEGLKYQTQTHVRSTHGKNAKGSKVTGIESMNVPPGNTNGDVKILVTSNDSRIRVYNLRDKGLELKFKGNENQMSQIHASFSDDGRYVICGSENRKVYIWATEQQDVERDKRPFEVFEAHPAIVTTAIMAPTNTKRLLSASHDPLYDLCNPPPVTLISHQESLSSSKPPTENGRTPDVSVPATPALTEDSARHPSIKSEESPAYLARTAHPNGNIIVSGDYAGNLRVFRQDCAHRNRLRNKETLNFSKKMLGRSNSFAGSRRSHRDSLASSHHPSADRILSWRQSVHSTNGSFSGSFDHRSGPARSVSPSKLERPSSTQAPNSTPRLQTQPSFATPSIKTTSPSPVQHTTFEQALRAAPGNSGDNATSGLGIQTTTTNTQTPELSQNPSNDNPLLLKGDNQSYMFWNPAIYRAQAAAAGAYLRPSISQTTNNETIVDDESSIGSAAEADDHDNNRQQRQHHRPSTIASSSEHLVKVNNDNNDNDPNQRIRNSNNDDGAGGGGFLHLNVPFLRRQVSDVSVLSSEEEDEKDESGQGSSSPGEEIRCKKCGGTTFKARAAANNKRVLVCGDCGCEV